MSTIQPAAWTNTNVQTKPSETQQKFSQLIHPETETNRENADGSKTIIERSVVTANDGSQIIILTSVTINADGSRGEVKPISKMKVGKNDNSLQPSIIDTKNLEKLASEDNNHLTNSGLIKNTAGNEYEQNSITGSYAVVMRPVCCCKNADEKKKRLTWLKPSQSFFTLHF